MSRIYKFEKNPKWNHSFEQTVPRSTVHRASVSEVFLTDAIKCGDSHFQCAAQLPRTHAYYNDHTHQIPHYDMSLLLEIFRQVSIYVSHSYLNVDPGDNFIYLDSELCVLQPRQLMIGDSSAPTAAIVDVKIADKLFRKGIQVGITLDMTLIMNEEQVAHKRTEFRWIDNLVWLRMRGKSISLTSKTSSNTTPPAPFLTPSLVGRQNQQNVVITGNFIDSTNEICASLNVDMSNPGLFDHPTDHIPGMLIIEGFRQTGLIAANRYLGINAKKLFLTHCKIGFKRIAELGVDTRCHVNKDEICLAEDPRTIVMPLVMEQCGRVTATALLKFSRIHHDNQIKTAMSSPNVEEA